ncbi:MAG: ribosome biogenesis GTPase Der, partial [Thermoanaerobaculaceae bacterium]|nr:ribosome biogenesis GTPase Der [Thermoanaerobaculaceae bacterium]
ALGIEPLFSISAEHGNGIDELLEEIAKNIIEDETKEEEREAIKIAIVGKPNVGKSSVLNRILGKKRSLVSEIAGTTRDPVDETIVLHDKIFTFIDTAGIRKRSKTEKGAEILSVILARKALESCDVALHVVDASLPPSHQDAYIAGLIGESRKGGIILLNKWDKIISEKEAKETELLFEEKFDFVPYIPQIKVSALTGKGFRSIFPKINSVYKSFRMKVTTSELNRALNEVIRGVAPPAVSGKEFKIKYGTQVSTSPPRFILFTNCEEDPPENYIRYIKNRFYEIFKVEGSPLIINFRRK